MEEQGYDTEHLLEDDEEARRLYIDFWVGHTGKYDAERLALEHVYARRAVMAEWLEEQGYHADDVLVFYSDPVNLSERDRRDENARKAILNLWIGHVTGNVRR